MFARPAAWSIAARLFVVQVAFVVAVGAVAIVWAWRTASDDVEADAASRCTALAVSIADNPFVRDAVRGDDPSTLLQPYAVELMADTSTDFITIMAPDRTRFTHPDPAAIGGAFQGTVGPALRGENFTETYIGTLGPSVRAVVPIEDEAGTVVALVSAGVTVAKLRTTVAERISIVLAVAVAAIALCALLSWLLSRYLRRVTGGRAPEELGRMLGYYEGVLHSVREGLVLVDGQGRLTMYNDQARELLDLPPVEDLPILVSKLPLPETIRGLLAGGATANDEVHLADERILVVNQQRTSSARVGSAGTVTTLRDRTELMKLTDEVRTMRTLSDALRAQTHEFANRLHTIVALIELGRADEAGRFAADELELGQAMADQLIGAIDEPILAALLLGKLAQARERAVELELRIAPDAAVVDVPASDLVTILGNLIDNAFDAASAPPRAAHPIPRVQVDIARMPGNRVRLTVEDDGDGIADVDRVFVRGYSTKAAGPEGRGLGLALVRQAVKRAGGRIEVTTGRRGTSFAVMLPVGPDRTTPAGPAPAASERETVG